MYWSNKKVHYDVLVLLYTNIIKKFISAPYWNKKPLHNIDWELKIFWKLLIWAFTWGFDESSIDDFEDILIDLFKINIFWVLLLFKTYIYFFVCMFWYVFYKVVLVKVCWCFWGHFNWLIWTKYFSNLNISKNLCLPYISQSSFSFSLFKVMIEIKNSVRTI